MLNLATITQHWSLENWKTCKNKVAKQGQRLVLKKPHQIGCSCLFLTVRVSANDAANFTRLHDWNIKKVLGEWMTVGWDITGFFDTDVSKNREKTPKMDGKNNGKPFFLKWMIWGYHYFGNTHTSPTPTGWFFDQKHKLNLGFFHPVVPILEKFYNQNGQRPHQTNGWRTPLEPKN